MSFLDNSGDIIFSAVLTDTGRMRMAKGDGSFKIAKFALADDEIDYSLWDGTNASGSAYYDVSILQTPVFLNRILRSIFFPLFLLVSLTLKVLFQQDSPWSVA